MSWLKTLFPREGRASDDEGDKHFWLAMRENYGYWLTIGCLNPKGPRWSKLLLLATLICWLILVATSYHVLYTDPGLVCESVHFIIFVVVNFNFWISFFIQSETIIDIYRQMGAGFYDYGELLDPETRGKVDRLIAQTKGRKKMLMKGFSLMAFLTYFSMNIARPLLKILNDDVTAVGQPGMFPLLPVTFWLPVQVTTLSYTLMFALVEVASFNFTGVVVGHIFFFLATCEEVSLECRVVALTLGSAKRISLASSVPLSVCLSHSIRHHQVIIRTVDKVERIVYYPAMFYIVCSGVLLCISGFLFLTDKIDLIAKMSFACFLISEMLGALVYCYYGEKVKTMSSEIYNELYFGDWIEDMVEVKNYNLIVQARSFDGLTISAGGFLQLNLETYTNVLSSAFSYFNILNAIST
uniref:Odorant receptor n=1 Tax=Yemma signatus TaxID=300820 RepID=A0A385H5V4_9HEMI|nr:odorant receptor [Yemma signatus]